MARHSIPHLIQRSNGYWYVSFEQERTSLETKDRKTANKRFKEWLNRRAQNDQVDSDPTIGVILTVYDEQHVQTKVKDKERSQNAIAMLRDFFEDMPISSVDRKVLQKWIARRKAGTTGTKNIGSNASINRELTALRSACNFMHKRVEPIQHRIPGWILPDIAGVFLDTPPSKDIVVLHHEIIKMLERAAPLPGERMSRLYRFLCVGFATGSRKEAIEQLEWAQINMKTRVIDLNPLGRVQTAKRRPKVPITDDLWPVIERAFEERKNQYFMDSPGSIRKAFSTFMAKWGYEAVTPHVLRHSCATRLASAGTSMIEIAALLGDDVTTIEKHYLHLSPGQLREGVNRRPEKPTDSTDVSVPVLHH